MEKRTRTQEERAAQFAIKTIATPLMEYEDVHGDEPPYHDVHDDGGTYYDHPDNEHFDYHHDHGDSAAMGDPWIKGDPAILVSGAIERLSRVLTEFEALQRGRLEKHSADVVARLERIEKRLGAIEARPGR